MLVRASFESFKALRRVDVALSPFTLLVGKNSSGKTSVLEGMHYASQVAIPRPHETTDPAGRLGLLFRGRRDPRRIITSPGRGPMRIALYDEQGRSLSVEASLPEVQDDLADEEQGCHFTVTTSGDELVALRMPDDGLQEAEKFLRRPDVRRFGSAVFLRLDAITMARPSVTESDQPRLEYDGEGLASVLNYLAGAEPAILSEIADALGTVVPGVQGIRTFPTQIMRQREERIVIGDQAVSRTLKEQVPGHRFSLDMGRGRIVPADLLSEGTVLTLGLLVALRHPRCPRLVLLDDVDKGLHPGAQAELVRCIRGILATRTDLQVVCTTHSPYLLDQVALDEVGVMALDGEGDAVFRRLSDHPDGERWRSMLGTGEFWASVGEDWLLSGKGDVR